MLGYEIAECDGCGPRQPENKRRNLSTGAPPKLCLGVSIIYRTATPLHKVNREESAAKSKTKSCSLRLLEKYR